MSITERILCLLIGYIFGLFQTGYIFGKLNGVDLRKEGSGNSGTTNALRVMGKKAGAVVFCGDVLKLALACYVTTHLFNGGHFYNDIGQLLLLYTGFGTVLGHNYPAYLHFRGGKGIACTGCMILILDWRLAIIEAIIFVVVVAVSHYVSLGSICVVSCFVVFWIIFHALGWLSLGSVWYMESLILVILWAALAIWRHRTNIGRLIHGNENKLF